MIVNDDRKMLGPCMLRFKTGSAATLVRDVHIYDGEQRVAAHDGLNLSGDQPFRRFGVAHAPEVRWGVGVSVGVPSAAATPTAGRWTSSPPAATSSHEGALGYAGAGALMRARPDRIEVRLPGRDVGGLIDPLAMSAEQAEAVARVLDALQPTAEPTIAGTEGSYDVVLHYGDRRELLRVDGARLPADTRATLDALAGEG